MIHKSAAKDIVENDRLRRDFIENLDKKEFPVDKKQLIEIGI